MTSLDRETENLSVSC